MNRERAEISPGSMGQAYTHDLQMEMVLGYLTKLARAFMANGATIEHTEIALKRNAEAYGLKGLSCVIMSGYVSVCFHDGEGHTYMKQLSIGDSGINLEKLRRLNDVSYRVCSERPAPEELGEILRATKEGKDYSPIRMLLFQILAICCVCYIIGGSYRDMVATAIVTFFVFWIFRGLARLRTDAIINNAAGMFAATVITYFLIRIGVTTDVRWVLIAVSLLMIPGIPLVNAFRNLICGNELNGLLMLLHVFLESVSLAAGTYLGVLVMGGAAAW